MARGMAQAKAASEGALARLRSVVMTALDCHRHKAKRSRRRRVGRRGAKAAGDRRHRRLILATVLTLFVLPTLYARFGRKETQPAPYIPASRGQIPA